jgi:hypothetical protein
MNDDNVRMEWQSSQCLLNNNKKVFCYLVNKVAVCSLGICKESLLTKLTRLDGNSCYSQTLDVIFYS